ncbi:MAG: SDR family oxidoreductase [Mesorhizobium sp.]|nr:MAG: SDR family oxidoreductase [Mesorhizobium sp.]
MGTDHQYWLDGSERRRAAQRCLLRCKRGLLGLTRCVALKAAPHGVTCNTVSPGHLITTSSSVSARLRIEREGLTGSVDDILAQRAKGTIQGRLIEPHEIAASVAFLCREEAKSFTMENLSSREACSGNGEQSRTEMGGSRPFRTERDRASSFNRACIGGEPCGCGGPQFRDAHVWLDGTRRGSVAQRYIFTP